MTPEEAKYCYIESSKTATRIKDKLIGDTRTIKLEVSKFSTTTQPIYIAKANCEKCHKPHAYVGDVPEGGWIPGQEPYCTCGVERCPHCNQIIKK
jgi:hypothetical protein